MATIGEHSLPVISLYKPFVEAGGLIAYGASTFDMYRHAADYVAKILNDFTSTLGLPPSEKPLRYCRFCRFESAPQRRRVTDRQLGPRPGLRGTARTRELALAVLAAYR
jgi:hypothetical protein